MSCLYWAACGKPKPATSSGWTDDETDSKLPPTTAPELGRHVSRFLSDLKRSMHKSTPPTTSRALPLPPPSKPGQGKAPVLSEVQVRKLVAQRRLAQQSNRFSDSVMGTPPSPPAPAPPLLPLPYSLSNPDYRPSPPAAPPPGHPSHRAHSLPHCPDQTQGQAGASSTLLLKAPGPRHQGPADNTTRQAAGGHTRGPAAAPRLTPPPLSPLSSLPLNGGQGEGGAPGGRGGAGSQPTPSTLRQQDREGGGSLVAPEPCQPGRPSQPLVPGPEAEDAAPWQLPLPGTAAAEELHNALLAVLLGRGEGEGEGEEEEGRGTSRCSSGSPSPPEGVQASVTAPALQPGAAEAQLWAAEGEALTLPHGEGGPGPDAGAVLLPGGEAAWQQPWRAGVLPGPGHEAAEKERQGGGGGTAAGGGRSRGPAPSDPMGGFPGASSPLPGPRPQPQLQHSPYQLPNLPQHHPQAPPQAQPQQQQPLLTTSQLWLDEERLQQAAQRLLLQQQRQGEGEGGDVGCGTSADADDEGVVGNDDADHDGEEEGEEEEGEEWEEVVDEVELAEQHQLQQEEWYRLVAANPHYWLGAGQGEAGAGSGGGDPTHSHDQGERQGRGPDPAQGDRQQQQQQQQGQARSPTPPSPSPSPSPPANALDQAMQRLQQLMGPHTPASADGSSAPPPAPQLLPGSLPSRGNSARSSVSSSRRRAAGCGPRVSEPSLTWALQLAAGTASHLTLPGNDHTLVTPGSRDSHSSPGGAQAGADEPGVAGGGAGAPWTASRDPPPPTQTSAYQGSSPHGLLQLHAHALVTRTPAANTPSRSPASSRPASPRAMSLRNSSRRSSPGTPSTPPQPGLPPLPPPPLLLPPGPPASRSSAPALKELPLPPPAGPRVRPSTTGLLVAPLPGPVTPPSHSRISGQPSRSRLLSAAPSRLATSALPAADPVAPTSGPPVVAARVSMTGAAASAAATWSTGTVQVTLTPAVRVASADLRSHLLCSLVVQLPPGFQPRGSDPAIPYASAADVCRPWRGEEHSSRKIYVHRKGDTSSDSEEERRSARRPAPGLAAPGGGVAAIPARGTRQARRMLAEQLEQQAWSAPAPSLTRRSESVLGISPRVSSSGVGAGGGAATAAAGDEGDASLCRLDSGRAVGPRSSRATAGASRLGQVAEAQGAAPRECEPGASLRRHVGSRLANGLLAPL